MRWTVVAIPVAALSLVAWLTPQALAQDTKTAGSVTAMAASSITVTSSGKNMTFTVNTDTEVIARGGSTASRAAKRTGKAGANLAELVKVGDSVEVTHRQRNGAMYAAVIRRVDAATAVRGAKADDKTASSNGMVDSVSGTMLTISGSTGGGGTFKQTFTIDGSTKVIAVGAGTAAAAGGGRISVTDVVGRGDRVSISYHPVGDTLHASEIRVREKAKK